MSLAEFRAYFLPMGSLGTQSLLQSVAPLHLLLAGQVGQTVVGQYLAIRLALRNSHGAI